MKKVLMTMFILVIIGIGNGVFAIQPTTKFYANDYANILSNKTENYIVKNSKKLCDSTTAQIVVVTVKNLNGETLEEYATNLFREFGIGDKEKNNGVLILVALEERKSRIEVGYGLEGILSDDKTGEIQDKYMIPYFKKNKFDEGIINGYNALYKEVAKKYNFSTNVKAKTLSASEEEDAVTVIETILILKVIYNVFLCFIEIESKKAKLINLVVLEVLSIIIAKNGILANKNGEGIWEHFWYGTLLNLASVFIHLPLSILGGIFGGYDNNESELERELERERNNRGGFSSGGSSSSDGGSFGGGGSSSGGGSSRGF